MKNQRSAEGGRRSIDKVVSNLHELRIETTALAVRVSHLSALNEGMREITDHVIKKMTQNSLDIVKSSADIESKINKWMVALVFFIAAGTGSVVILMLEMGIGK